MADRSPLKRLTERLGLDALGRGVLGEDGSGRLQGLGRRAAPFARLARIDGGVLRAWIRGVGAIEDALGLAEGNAFTDLVIATAERDPGVARVLAFTMPDHLARVPPAQRGRYVALLKGVGRQLPDALPLCARTLPDLLPRMDDDSLVRHLSGALELFSSSSQKAESFLRLESAQGQRSAAALERGIRLSDVSRTLTHYARAHCGEDVQVRPGDDRAFTDGRHLYLPERVTRFGDERDRLIYRVLTARNAGFLEFGTMDLDLGSLPGDWPERRPDEVEVERMLRAFPNSSLARDLFLILEGARVEARVRAEYPGIARDMDALADAWRPERPDPASLAPAEQAVELVARLALGLAAPALADAEVSQAGQTAAGALARVRAPEAGVNDSVIALQEAFAPIFALLERAKPKGQPPRSGGGEGGRGERGDRGSGRDPDRGQRGDRRGEGEDELSYRPSQRDPFGPELRTERLGERERQTEAHAAALHEALRARDPEATRADAREAARRAERDGTSYEEMAEFLDRMQAPAGPLQERDPALEAANLPVGHTTGQALDADAEAKPSVHLYPEWDLTLEDYKPRWVRLTEYRLLPGSTTFVEDVRRRHGALIRQVRRSFEALRPEAVRRVRGVVDGDEIDLDRAIEAHVERRAGGSPTDRTYVRHQRDERDVAVAFLVDMSSSTNELANVGGQRIIDVEKEALVLISEAVDAIGDAAAIYGFSGYGREQVAFYVAKDFHDPWDSRVQERIGRISWKMENRDGTAIRHATRKLMKIQARVRILLLLSDGKPLDCGCDHYSDRYAQEDTRVALQEARKLGVHPFCITVDIAAAEYMSRMYGDAGYTIIDRVDHLPQRLPQIYRRLTR